MPNRADNTVSSTQVIPAGHAALTAEDDLGEHASPRLTGLVRLSVAALGVVFGDIGTSPVYTFRECFNPEHLSTGFPSTRNTCSASRRGRSYHQNKGDRDNR